MSKRPSVDLTSDVATRAKNMLAESVLVATRQGTRSESKALVAKILDRIETSDGLKVTLAEIRKEYGIGY
jgi:hypothetical protein